MASSLGQIEPINGLPTSFWLESDGQSRRSRVEHLQLDQGRSQALKRPAHLDDAVVGGCVPFEVGPREPGTVLVEIAERDLVEDLDSAVP